MPQHPYIPLHFIEMIFPLVAILYGGQRRCILQRQVPSAKEEGGGRAKGKEADENDIAEENKKFLRTLSTHEVCFLPVTLHVLHPSKYESIFFSVYFEHTNTPPTCFFMNQNILLFIPSPPSPCQVCELLGAMDLSQYKEAFTRESVTGELLADCDNDILQSDLSVTSRLHRLRLMKVISGRHSAASLIEGADPYVTLGKK